MINILYEWLEKNELPEEPKPSEGKWCRSQVDDFYTEISSRLCKHYEWKTPINALQYYTSGKDPWDEWGVSKKHIEAAVRLRTSHPSIFAAQSICDERNELYVDVPPFYWIFKNGCMSTIKDTELGVQEDIDRIKKSVAEQLICSNELGGYRCQTCGNELTRGSHINDCSGKIKMDYIGLDVREIEFI